ncbi:MAG: mercuric transport protein [Nitrospirales bacterium]|nr:MAG: mercuric transport protein [Nitrospirales bacterium]
MNKNTNSDVVSMAEKPVFQEDEGTKHVIKPASVASLGGIIAAFLASLCCIGPVVFSALGVGAGTTGLLASTAGFMKGIVPYRPFFIVVALGAIGSGFYLVYRTPKTACASDAHCTETRTGSKSVDLLWMATALTLIFVLSPYWLGIFK